MAILDPDRLFPADPKTRAIAKDLYSEIEDLPIISPHGHTDPAWFSLNEPFPDPAQLFVTPDHYVFRMLFSQGIELGQLGVPSADGSPVETHGRAIWRLFARNYHLFRATPSRMWIDHALEVVFGITDPLTTETADAIYDHLSNCLSDPAFRPRALFDRFGIEALATTDAALDNLSHHQAIANDDWAGRVLPTYRPDSIVDPDATDFRHNIEMLGDVTGEDTGSWLGYLAAHRTRRAYFAENGATATDHGHPEATTADLDLADAEALFSKVLSGRSTAEENKVFRAQMLTEMAGMSVEDGLVMQLHPGSVRSHSADIHRLFGPDKGFDIPKAMDYTQSLRPLLNKYGTNPKLTLILFTLDEATYARELAPLAGVYPALKLGPAWWFFDSPEGMLRYRAAVTETAGFYNTVGFNDDTRAFCSIPARHDVARRVDCAYLAELVVTGRLGRSDASELVYDLTYRLAKEGYKL